MLNLQFTRGQYYCILDIGCLTWYRSNPRQFSFLDTQIVLFLLIYLHHHHSNCTVFNCTVFVRVTVTGDRILVGRHFTVSGRR